MTRLTAAFVSGAALASLALVTGCGSNGSDESNATSDGARDGGFESLTDLRDAAVSAGLDCPTWSLAAVDSGEGGLCGDSASVNLFADHAAAQAAAEELSDLLGGMGMDYTLLVGDNWFISADNAAELKDDLGGELVTGP